MTNLEPIVRKLIEAALYKYQDADRKTRWHLFYKDDSITKPFYPDESQDQVIDWFYYNVLQLEHKEEA
jgi:hypothetical protein